MCDVGTIRFEMAWKTSGTACWSEMNSDDDATDEKVTEVDVPNALSQLLEEYSVQYAYGAVKAAAGSASLRAVAALGPKALAELAGLPSIKAAKVLICFCFCFCFCFCLGKSLPQPHSKMGRQADVAEPF